MKNSATDIMQEILFSAVMDAVAALKTASKGMPNSLLRDINAMGPNTAFADLPKEVQAGITGAVRTAFNRLLKEGYSVPAQRPPGRGTWPPAGRSTRTASHRTTLRSAARPTHADGWAASGIARWTAGSATRAEALAVPPESSVRETPIKRLRGNPASCMDWLVDARKTAQTTRRLTELGDDRWSIRRKSARRCCSGQR
jgi:hypothetical protein